MHINRKLQQETDYLQQAIDDIRNKHIHTNEELGRELGDLYGNLGKATDAYNETENDYQSFKQEMRVEIHDDKTLINDLEESLVEADMILGSLRDKAKFSSKLEKERQRMLKDRSVLLRDLCSHEKLKYKKQLGTLPSFIEIPYQNSKPMNNITSKIRHKLFKSNGQMRTQSTDHYTRRESHVQQELRKLSDKKRFFDKARKSEAIIKSP